MNLGASGAENQNVAMWLIGNCSLHESGHAHVPLLTWALWRRVRNLDGKGAAGCGHDRSRCNICAENGGHGCAIESRRHHHDAKVGPQILLHVQRKRQPHVAMQISLVEFVENQAAHAIECRVGMQHASEYSLGDHLNSMASASVAAHAIANVAANGLIQRGGHSLGGGTGGQPSWFEHQDFSGAPGLLNEVKWHNCGLAGAGWCHQHRVGILSEGRRQFGQHVIDWQTRWRDLGRETHSNSVAPDRLR